MKVGDLVDDGLDNIGIIVALGWVFPTSERKRCSYKVHFLTDPDFNGWYDAHELKLVSQPTEGT